MLKVTRAQLENIAREFVDRSIEIAQRALDNSPFKKEKSTSDYGWRSNSYANDCRGCKKFVWQRTKPINQPQTKL